MSLYKIIVLAPSIPHFKGLGMRNLQSEIRICQKSHNTVTITVYVWFEFLWNRGPMTRYLFLATLYIKWRLPFYRLMRLILVFSIGCFIHSCYNSILHEINYASIKLSACNLNEPAGISTSLDSIRLDTDQSTSCLNAHFNTFSRHFSSSEQIYFSRLSWEKIQIVQIHCLLLTKFWPNEFKSSLSARRYVKEGGWAE